MTRNARMQEKRPPLCHADAGAPEGSGANESARADNFRARAQSNAKRRATGARFEAHALAFLRRESLALVARNVNCRGGELDLVMRERDGTLVFVEVRARARPEFGGAAASVGWRKQQRVLRAARYFLATWRGADANAEAHTQARTPPACRFDVIAFESGRLVWLRDAFQPEADES
ncbi:YraN family protein [Paraburkholderia sp. CNPSo 3272]|uniref:YraN family protein n=1 Tax=Paraburkholderia sp. CNPSo 3272 TaxID=2940931 RepID=UPI0020B87541|nr:YraN family protein [Paraburkholderia sp. CNPSo 3272]MCP3728403.1 YraN family protein [Paraburkholderia sp. CNPSo 3272]